VVSDAPAARQELLDRGVEVSPVAVIADADGGTFFGFQDPDGNTWAVQEIKARARKPLIPETTQVSANGLVANPLQSCKLGHGRRVLRGWREIGAPRAGYTAGTRG